jgi:hypothetical protein
MGFCKPPAYLFVALRESARGATASYGPPTLGADFLYCYGYYVPVLRSVHFLSSIHFLASVARRPFEHPGGFVLEFCGLILAWDDAGGSVDDGCCSQQAAR